MSLSRGSLDCKAQFKPGVVYIHNVAPTGEGSVGSKQYLTTEQKVLVSAISDTTSVTVTVVASSPKIEVNGVSGVLSAQQDTLRFAGDIEITLPDNGGVIMA